MTFHCFWLIILISFQAQALPVITSEQMQPGNQWTWDYYEKGSKNIYSSERYTVVKRNKDIVTLDLYTQVAGSKAFTPSARFVVNLQDCWSAFKTPVKKEFQIECYAFQKDKWGEIGYRVASTAFEEKFNCNPYLYPSDAVSYETVFAIESTPWGEQQIFQQNPKGPSQLKAFYFANHKELSGVAYHKQFNPLSPYEFEMFLSHFETEKILPRP